MTVLKEETVLRMIKFAEMDIVKFQAKKGLFKIELDTKIYIPFSKTDLITEDNLDDNSYPDMLAEDLDLKCRFDKKKYDPTK